MSRWLEELLAECFTQTSTSRLWHGHTCAHISYLSSSRAWLSNVCQHLHVEKAFIFPEKHPSNASMSTELELRLLMVSEGSHIKRCFWSGPFPEGLLTSSGSNFACRMHAHANALQPEWVLHPIMCGICPAELMMHVYGEPVGSQRCLTHVEIGWHGPPAAGVLSPAAPNVMVVLGLLMLMWCAAVLLTPQDTCPALIADQCRRMTWKSPEPQKPT